MFSHAPTVESYSLSMQESLRTIFVQPASRRTLTKLKGSSMIRDAKGYATEIAQISPDLRDKMILVIRDRIIRNLLAIKQLVVIGGYDDICGGLYTYVVEEYGKILFLKSLPVGNDGKIEFKY